MNNLMHSIDKQLTSVVSEYCTFLLFIYHYLLKRNEGREHVINSLIHKICGEKYLYRHDKIKISFMISLFSTVTPRFLKNTISIP